MTKKYDAVATVGSYNDRETGQPKKRYQTVGAVFEDEQGRLSLKLEAIPLSKEWSGWLSFYEPRQPGQPSARSSAPPAQEPAPDLSGDDGDDIPF